MIIEAIEVGQRPTLLTRARVNAPPGVKKLAELFGQQDFADKAILILDWQPEEIAEASEPIVRVYVYKRHEGRLLTLEQRYSVNSIFETDIVTTNDLGWITEEFRKKLEYELVRAN